MNETGKYRAGDLLVDMAKRSVSRDGEHIALSDLSWRVLSVLISRSPETVEYDELATLAWPQQQVSPDTMSQRIKLLRRSLDDDPKAPRYVATERGIGYRFVAEVEELSATPPSNQKRVLLAAAASIAAVALLFLWKPNQDAVLAPQTTDITAAISINDLIERGNQYLARGTFEDNERALSLFEQAQEKDQGNVAAMIGQSLSHSHRETKYDFDRASSKKAMALAQQALDLSPRNGDAWHALGFAFDAQGNSKEALRAYEQAIAIDPENLGAISSAAYVLQVQGRFHEALLLVNDVLAREQTRMFTFIQIASSLRLSGLDDAANIWLTRAETLRPDTIFLADTKVRFLLARQQYSDAAAVSNDTANDDHASLMVLHGEAQLALGDIDAAIATFENALLQDKNNFTGVFEKTALEIDPLIWKNQIDSHPLMNEIRMDREGGDQWPYLSIGAAYLYAAINDGEATAAALRDAHRWGYRDVERLRASPFLSTVQNQPAIQSVLADIQKDVDIQRSLIENDERLAHLLNLEP